MIPFQETMDHINVTHIIWSNNYYATNGNKKQVLVYIDKDFYGMYKQFADEELR